MINEVKKTAEQAQQALVDMISDPASVPGAGDEAVVEAFRDRRS